MNLMVGLSLNSHFIHYKDTVFLRFLQNMPVIFLVTVSCCKYGVKNNSLYRWMEVALQVNLTVGKDGGGGRWLTHCLFH